jgi:predicted DCC family thiol-disulfide oxidoreductase YuxK
MRGIAHFPGTLAPNRAAAVDELAAIRRQTMPKPRAGLTVPQQPLPGIAGESERQRTLRPPSPTPAMQPAFAASLPLLRTGAAAGRLRLCRSAAAAAGPARRTPRRATRACAAAGGGPDAPPAAAAEPGPIRLLWDGECPLCVREVGGLRARAAAFAKAPVEFVDIAEDGYEAAENGGVGYAEAMGRIHAVMGDGEVVAGVEVFRRVYDALGIGWVYAPTRLPVVGAAVEAAYDVWAANRLRLTGRATLEAIVAAREKAAAVAARGEATCR